MLEIFNAYYTLPMRMSSVVDGKRYGTSITALMRGDASTVVYRRLVDIQFQKPHKELLSFFVYSSILTFGHVRSFQMTLS